MGQVPDYVGQVLVQGPAEVHVEDLAAAADGQNREVHAEGGVEQGALARRLGRRSTPATSGAGSSP